LSAPNTVTLDAYFAQLATVLYILMTPLSSQSSIFFMVQHFIFRWRTAMNDYYVANWDKLRRIEGASQRIQEDTMRFARTMEDLGTSLIQSVMTLVAFLPILWGFLPTSRRSRCSATCRRRWSSSRSPGRLLAPAFLPSPVSGCGVVLPQSARGGNLSKGTVLGEDNAERAQPPTLAELFTHVRRNYFTLTGIISISTCQV